MADPESIATSGLRRTSGQSLGPRADQYGDAEPIEQSKTAQEKTRDASTKQPGASAMDEPTIALAIDPVALITTECISVTSAMRKNARWAQSSVSAILGGSAVVNHSLQPPSSSFGSGQHGRRSSGAHTWSSEPPANGDNGHVVRWGLRGKRGKSLQDNPLMSSFSRLRGELKNCVDIRRFDTPTLLHPFLQVIRSSSTSASITSLALVAITKFFAYNLITEDSPRLSLGMQLLSAAVTHCRFEASDSAADEIVLLRILKLMEGMLSGPGGPLLSDESVCEMMETGLSMCCQARLSELLRRTAEMSMMTMCQTVFKRLKTLENEIGDDAAAFEATCTSAESDGLRMDAPLETKMPASSSSTPLGTPSKTHDSLHPPLAIEQKAQADFRKDEADRSGRTSVDQEEPSQQLSGPRNSENPPKPSKESMAHTEEVPDIRPYSLPSIRELFRVLVDLLDPHDRQHTDSMRVVALRIIDVALEVAGPSISKHSSLAVLAKDNLCRNLFQLVRSENLTLLNESLRVAGTLLSTCRGVLKLQQELFLSYLVACLHPRIEIPREPGIDPSLYEGVPQAPKAAKPPESSTNSGRSTPVPVKDRQKLGLEGGARKPDAREAMIESIGALARIPYFLPELFVNYDCEVDRGDLCEDFVGLLSRNAFPDSATWSTTNVPPLCLDALLGYVQFIAERLNDGPAQQDLPEKAKLLRQRAMKKVIIRGATKFNENPKGGIAHLASQGIIQTPEDPASVAKFLKGTSRVSKKVLGEYISKKSCEPLLAAFIDLFDFSNKRVDEALRDLLGAFRLPGESPLIERIVTIFSEKYCLNTTPEGVADKDAVFVLTYAIIMLNTDQHNPNVRSQNRMTFEAFAKNLRGVNGGKDFDHKYLEEIFNSIRTNEIILPDEHDNKHAFDYAWQELLAKAEGSGDLLLCHSNLFDADMFEATWRPVVATLSYVFMSASEDAVYQRVVTGFDQCAQIAAKYGLSACLDRIIRCLSNISTIASMENPNTSLNTEVQVHEKPLMVSELAVRFGREYKAQLATIVLFRGVIAGNEAGIAESWKDIVLIWKKLFVNSLLPPSFPDSRALLGIPPIPMRSPSQVINREERANGSGLFQSFTSYLSSYAADDPPEPSEDEVNDTLCTYDCLASCPVDQIFDNFLRLPAAPLAILISTLLNHMPQQDSAPVVAVVKPESDPLSPGKPGARHSTTLSEYDPSIIYLLEIATILTIRNHQVAMSTEQDVMEALQGVVRNSNSFHPIITSRSAFYLLRLLHAKHGRAFVRTPVILHSISSLDNVVVEKSALQLLGGFATCLDGPTTLRSEILNTPDFWSTIRQLHGVKGAADEVFQLLNSILEDASSSVTANNYEAVVHLLHEVATVGSEGAAPARKLDRNGRRPMAVKSGQTKYVYLHQLLKPSLTQQGIRSSSVASGRSN